MMRTILTLLSFPAIVLSACADDPAESSAFVRDTHLRPQAVQAAIDTIYDFSPCGGDPIGSWRIVGGGLLATDIGCNDLVQMPDPGATVTISATELTFRVPSWSTYYEFTDGCRDGEDVSRCDEQPPSAFCTGVSGPGIAGVRCQCSDSYDDEVIEGSAAITIEPDRLVGFVSMTLLALRDPELCVTGDSLTLGDDHAVVVLERVP